MESAILGERGQVTIPKKIRERLGMKPKSPVFLEVTSEGLLIRPAITVALREFSDAEIEGFAAGDRISPEERERILDAWKK